MQALSLIPLFNSYVFHMTVGRPKPQYKWLKDGKSLTDFRDDEIYKINDAKTSDSGLYQCLARNDAGTIFSNKSEIVVACEFWNFKSFSLVHPKISEDLRKFPKWREILKF